MNEDLLSPLNADPSRQAIPSLRGYVYQVARTALAWLELPEGEMIQVEGAEDFDRVGRTEGVATQVKALRNNITLRNSDVSEAIQNFWILRRDNPGRYLAFRFLTTARPGHEDGDPFGMPGIVFWNGLLREADPAMRRAGANRLRLFLADRQAFSAEFRAYLRDVDTDDFFENLVAPLHFETDLAGIEGVEEDGYPDISVETGLATQDRKTGNICWQHPSIAFPSGKSTPDENEQGS